MPEEKTMKLKLAELNGKQYAEIQDGKPVIIEEDGKEIPFDIAHTRSTISRLNNEAKTWREKTEANDAKLKLFEGIEDPELAKKALDTIKNLEEGKLVAAGKVEEIKAEAKKAAEEQVAAGAKQYAAKLAAAEKERDSYRDSLYAEKIGGAFSRSKFISEKAAIPADIMQARFGTAFKVEEGKTVAYDSAGNKIYSKSRPGEHADFDEALEVLVDQYTYRDQIMKGTGSTGSGMPSIIGANGARSISRAEFDKMPPMQQFDVAKKGTAIVD
jgi:hypothetical protein